MHVRKDPDDAASPCWHRRLEASASAVGREATSLKLPIWKETSTSSSGLPKAGTEGTRSVQMQSDGECGDQAGANSLVERR